MLALRSVSRSFGDHQVLHDVSFEVGAGTMTGFVGANGAGKTTAMRIILGVLGADSGTVSWRGSPIDQTTRQRFGYMPEERGLYPKMKVAEQIVYLARLHGLDQPTARRNCADLLEQLELTERADDPVEQLSLGNQQRAQIAAALAFEPELLILDEPFSGLDPLAVETVLSVLRERARTGVPVLFSSHQLEVVERLCDNLVVIAEGRIAAAGARAELQQRQGPPRYELTVDDDAGWIRDMPHTTVVELAGATVQFDVTVAGAEQVVLQEATRRGPVHSFRPIVPTLSEIFREVIR
ncbi:ATP-binding cassette domain-containing protein [Natronosporangium hydrolyticum]|uniref:ATP-binding cassette domain-containing protein n=1 Tax=Natronosporangium hydrolyticum TaxID=2811111 RepID=A0A895YI82_9ACTN|nr:ATP-binding cassette domain-containing protein [Natronosporangium hydrolyticum]QSB14276.1 ATP-binding cassette domain-containing protein [Natronosporangium hydrolyticum]